MRSEKLTEQNQTWSRRKDARPAEIMQAAMAEFAEKGFAETKLSDVAKRAGVVKGTIYRYFENKEDLFKEVVRQSVSTNLEVIHKVSSTFDGDTAEFIPFILSGIASQFSDSTLPSLIRMVLAESRKFPDLANIWHDEVIVHVMGVLVGLIENAQARGIIKEGDPKLFVFSMMGPMLLAMLFREIFGNESEYAPDLHALSVQHSALLFSGINKISKTS